MNKDFITKISFVFVLILITIIIFVISKNIQNKQIAQNQLLPSPTLAPSVNEASSSANTFVLGIVKKISGCISLNGLPDKECTPGEADPKVTQENIAQTICVAGYTKSVRPSTSYTNKLKVKQIKQYGFTDSILSDYEEDHLISLELGGSPKSEANLWPESYKISQNAREKDKVENYLHDQVCLGKISLIEAQFKIANDWEEVYKTLY